MINDVPSAADCGSELSDQLSLLVERLERYAAQRRAHPHIAAILGDCGTAAAAIARLRAELAEMAADRDSWADQASQRTQDALDLMAAERERCAELEAVLEALVNRCNADFVLAADEAVIAAEAALERLYRARKA